MKNTFNFPEWFSLEKYKNAIDFDSLDWWINTHMRFCIMKSLPLNSDEWPTGWLKETREFGAMSDLFNHYGGEDYFKLSSSFLVGEEERYWYKDSDGTCNISVNLRASDKELTKAFEYFLKEKRKEKQPAKKYFTQADFNSWHKFGVLPYLDIEIWRIETGINKIPDHILGDAILANEVDIDTTEAIRKSTRKHIDRIKKSGLLLRNQGKLDRSE